MLSYMTRLYDINLDFDKSLIYLALTSTISRYNSQFTGEHNFVYFAMIRVRLDFRHKFINHWILFHKIPICQNS